MQVTTEQITNLLDAYNFFRSAIVDTVEAEVKDSERWPFIRGRLLRYMGQSGFEGKLLCFLKLVADEDLT